MAILPTHPRAGIVLKYRMDIAQATYVVFTTFRRSGEAVTTPVWIAPLGSGRAGFTTAAASGKAKRLTHTPTVRLQRCNARGVVTSDSQPIEVTARLARDDAEVDEIRAAIRAKYGWQYTAITAAGKVADAVRRKGNGMTPDAAVVIDLAP